MEFDFDNASSEFKAFYKAFSPETYGASMGRAAEDAVIYFDRFSIDEKQIITNWFLALFEQQKDYYAAPYLWVVEKIDDVRFLPYLKIYLKKLKMKHHKKVRSSLNGQDIEIRTDFSSDIKTCKKLIRKLHK